MTITHLGIRYYVWDKHDIYALCFRLKLNGVAA